MPYKSAKQERWAHTPAGTKALGGPAKVKEWDRETKAAGGVKKPAARPKGGKKGR